ncbi:hypothetical protein [Pseudomonas fluorescens]|uniref:hypothetical protein n=1 Tax=Pseudomonas fluorescens TaxID=294 RepID=UPI00126A14FD|nr:hypothetical protein [Pseudomonas fluorescens]
MKLNNRQAPGQRQSAGGFVVDFDPERHDAFIVDKPWRRNPSGIDAHPLQQTLVAHGCKGNQPHKAVKAL